LTNAFEAVFREMHERVVTAADPLA
jgi:hypothetical protein